MNHLLHQIEALEHDAAAFGFRWENTQQIMAQIRSECEEINAHLQNASLSHAAELQEEIGDLLHAACSLCVFCEFSVEDTLQNTLNKFAHRLAYVKKLAQQDGLPDLVGYSFDKLMSYWDQAKQLALEASRTPPTISHSSFNLDERLASSCFTLIDWPLSRVLLKNNAIYPWLILVPRRAALTEITALSKADRQQLAEETHQAAIMMQTVFNPDKINTGSLGNVVTQLHIHVVGRFQHDPLWPQSIWQQQAQEIPYQDATSLIATLQQQLANILF